MWRNDSLSDPLTEGFRLASSGAVRVVAVCLSARCRSSATVSITGPAAINADGTPAPESWMLIDTSTGEIVDSTQQWSDPDTFRQECCGGGEFVWVGHDGGVVTAVNAEHIAIWYP